MTTTVQITLKKHPDDLVRVSLVQIATGEVLAHHDVMAGNCQEICEFAVYEGVRLHIEERASAPSPEKKPVVVADAPQPTASAEAPAEGQPAAATPAEPPAHHKAADKKGAKRK